MISAVQVACLMRVIPSVRQRALNKLNRTITHESDRALSDYDENLNASGLFDNAANEALPQTIVYKLVVDHFSSPLPAGKTLKKALIIGYDGFRSDEIKCENEAKSAILELKTYLGGGIYHSFAGGISGVNEQKTSTGPGWTSMLTGGWADYHGVFDNSCSKNERETFLTELSKQGLHTAFIARWRPFFASIYKPDIVRAIRENLTTRFEYALDDAEIYFRLLRYVEKSDAASKAPDEDPDVLFAIFELSDEAGHSNGFFPNAEYTKACQEVDAYAYEVLEAVEARSTYAQEDWLILITTDHGGREFSHGGQSPSERSTWIAINRPLDITDEWLHYARTT